MGYGSNGNSYQGYQGGSGVHNNPYRSNGRRKDYEELSNGSSNRSSPRNNGRMQSMEVLSGREYGMEFDGSSGSGSSQAMKNRVTIYCLLGFLILIVLVAPHRDHSQDNSSNFKLPKNSNRTKPTSSSTTTQAPTSSQSPEESKQESETSSTIAPSNATATISTSSLSNSTRPAYADQCHLPSSFLLSNNFTVLNDTNYCIVQSQEEEQEQQSSAASSSCSCLDPTTPAQPEYSPVEWPRAMQMNIELVEKAIATASTVPLDVVFLGDSITEHWNGRDMAEFRPKDHNASVVFQELFSKTTNASNPEGLALGIAGDRCQNVLYRLQHGEMPAALQPKVWWILIGTNDLGSDDCNANAITAGTIRIVEEILHKHQPDATIVLNSILPRGNFTTKTNQELLHASRTWPVMTTINQRLECYANNNAAHVHFFNATDMFIYTKEEEDGGGVYINETLMNDFLHPSGEGLRIWGQAMANKVLELTTGS